MTVERHIELQDRLREVLGEQPAATLWGMLPGREDLATKTDLSELENRLRTEIVEFRDGLRGEITGVRGEIGGVREELKGEMSEFRSELASMRLEMEHRFKGMENRFEGMEHRFEGMEHRFATKDDLFAVVNEFNQAMQGYVRTFIVVQAATVVGMSTILFGLLRFF